MHNVFLNIIMLSERTEILKGQYSMLPFAINSTTCELIYIEKNQIPTFLGGQGLNDQEAAGNLCWCWESLTEAEAFQCI